MLIRILLRWLISALAIWVATAILPGVDVLGGFWTYLWVALLLGLVNVFLGTILRILTLPLTILTLGLFAIIVNTAVVVHRVDLQQVQHRRVLAGAARRGRHLDRDDGARPAHPGPPHRRGVTARRAVSAVA